MNALLITMESPDSFWSYKHTLKFIGKQSSILSLGILTVAALLPEEWDKRYIDLEIAKLTDEDVEWADCAFISATIVHRDRCREIIELLNKAGVRVVAGGPLFANEFDQYDGVDHFVLNEAEITLPRFLADLENGCPERVYQTDEFCKLSESPIPIWKLADLRKYSSISVQYSRGCPYDCEFCDVASLVGSRHRTKPHANVIAELESLSEAGYHGLVFFADDNFVGNKHKLKTGLMPALIEWRKKHPKFIFMTEVSIDIADDPELMDMMVKAGFDSVFIGIETSSEEALVECGKDQNRNRNLVEDVRKIQRAGLVVQAGFILGFDTDTPSVFDRQIEFIQKSGIVVALITILMAPRSTRLYERLQSEGRLKEYKYGDRAFGATNVVTLMPESELIEGYKRILANIYSPKNLYARILNFLRVYNAPDNRPKLGLQEIMAFFRVQFHIGLLAKERFQYWKLLIWTGFRSWKLYPVAITLAVYGRHLITISDRVIKSTNIYQ